MKLNNMDEEKKNSMLDLIIKVIKKSTHSLTATQITHRIEQLALIDLVGEYNPKLIKEICKELSIKGYLKEVPQTQLIDTYALGQRKD